MAGLKDSNDFWSVKADQNVTRRKWYFLLLNPQGERVYEARRLTDCLTAAWADDQHEVRLELLDGTIWHMKRMGKQKKEPE